MKKGETVTTITTDENGEWQSPELYLGKYQAIEVSAPNGFIIDDRPIPFGLKYAGQLVELTSTSITATNDFHSLVIQLFKEVELINPVADTVATATFQGADVNWYIKADDIILKKPAGSQPNLLKQNSDKK